MAFATTKKKGALRALLESYRSAVNFYIRSLWDERGKLDRETLARLPKKHTRLSERFKSQALKQALEVVVATKKAARELGKPCSRPYFRGAATLDAKFVSVEEGRGSFDLVLRLSCLKKGARVTIPTRRTRVLNKWLARPGAELIQGCSLSGRGVTLWVKFPNAEESKRGTSLGVDIGVNKLLSSSDGIHLGTDFRRVRDKIRRKSPGSKAKGRAIRERDNYIRQQVNKLPWSRLGLLAVEDLKNLKRGKGKRGKRFRKAMAPWTYRQVIGALRQKAQENRVHLELVEPAYTSQMCPRCETVSRRNRRAENFRCINCGYSQDADTVGAMNILNKALRLVGSVESPMPSEDR